MQTLDGGSNPQGRTQAGIEAVSLSRIVIPTILDSSTQDLDVQYTIGIASGVPTVFISVGNNFKDGALEGMLSL